MAKGRVKWFDPKKGFGFVVNHEGQDVFVHYTGIEQEGFRYLRSGQTVQYRQVQTPKGLQARDVAILNESAGSEIFSEPFDQTGS